MQTFRLRAAGGRGTAAYPLHPRSTGRGLHNCLQTAAARSAAPGPGRLFARPSLRARMRASLRACRAQRDCVATARVRDVSAVRLPDGTRTVAGRWQLTCTPA